MNVSSSDGPARLDLDAKDVALPDAGPEVRNTACRPASESGARRTAHRRLPRFMFLFLLLLSARPRNAQNLVAFALPTGSSGRVLRFTPADSPADRLVTQRNSIRSRVILSLASSLDSWS